MSTSASAPHIVVVLPWGARYAPNARPGAIELCAEGFVADSRYRATTTILTNIPVDDQGQQHAPFEVGNFVAVSDKRVRGDRFEWCRLVVEKLRALKPDLVVVHQTCLTAQQIRKAFPDLPLILHRHDSQVPSSPFKHWGQNWQMRAATKVVANSDYVLRHHKNRCLIPAHKLKRIYNSLDFSRFDPNQPKQKKIVCVAAMMPKKGSDLFAGAIRPILDAHPDWSIDFVCVTQVKSSKAWRQSKIYDQVQGIGQDRLRFTDVLPYQQILRLYQEAAIAVVPSRYQEPFGRTALEAVASKAVLVTSGTGGLAEIGGDFAAYPGRQNPQAYADAIIALISDEEKRLSMAQQAYDRAKGLFEQALISEAYDDFVDEILSQS